jgi:hypothetical protein
MRSTNKAEQAIIRRGEPLQLQLPGFWPAIAPKRPLSGRAMAVFADGVMVQ